MLSGEITAQNGDTYNLTLSDGQALKITSQCLPVVLQTVGQRVNLIFDGVEGPGADPAEARTLLNSLLLLG